MQVNYLREVKEESVDAGIGVVYCTMGAELTERGKQLLAELVTRCRTTIREATADGPNLTIWTHVRGKKRGAQIHGIVETFFAVIQAEFARKAPETAEWLVKGHDVSVEVYARGSSHPNFS